jgi:radical SAM protein with 4Fe4S-binding SPASM domain
VDLGAKVNIISNALVFTDNHLKLAKEAGLSNVAFSLDGFEEEHDQFRREGSFARVLEATRRCLDGGLPVAINTTVNNLNKHILPELRDFLGELGIFSWQIQVATPSGNLSEHRELVIQPEDMLWLVPQIAKMRLQRDITPSVNPGDDIGYYGKCEKAIRDSGADISFWIGCRAGCQVIGIESNGNIKGCLSLPSSMHGEDKFVEGNIRNGRLADIWNRPGGFAYNRDFTEDQLGGFCAVCRYRTFCRGGCTWTAFSHTKNRYDNPYCLHQQAVKHRRFDLLEEEPLEAELAFFAQPEKKARKANR